MHQIVSEHVVRTPRLQPIKRPNTYKPHSHAQRERLRQMEEERAARLSALNYLHVYPAGLGKAIPRTAEDEIRDANLGPLLPISRK